MPYHADGSKKKNPSKKDWRMYQSAKSNRLRKNGKNASGGKTGGAAIGGGGASA